MKAFAQAVGRVGCPLALGVGLILMCDCQEHTARTIPHQEDERPSPTLRPLTSRDATAPPTLHSSPVIERETIAGSITIAASLEPKTSPADVLFLIARRSSDQQIIAVQKHEHVQLPQSFELGAADVMMPGTAFEGPFDLTARLSKSGDAIPAAGDLEGTARGVIGGARDVRIQIDRVRG